jgi:catechol-2,3-dioxygenase
LPEFTGVSHIGLTISDVERSKAWYSDVLGWQMLMEGTDEHGTTSPSVSCPAQSGLDSANTPEGSGEAFSPERTGLDHASFTVASRQELDEWASHLAEKGAAYSEIVEAPYGQLLSFKDPDGIALEAFVMGGGI